MRIQVRVLLHSVTLALALAIAAIAPAQAAGLNLETATIADLNAAFASGTLTSEQLVEAKDAGTDRVVEGAIVTLRKLGAVVIDPIRYPDYLIQ